MRKAIAILAVIVGLSSAGYAYWLHSQPRLPYYAPHHVTDGGCAAWQIEKAIVILCEGGMAVAVPKTGLSI
jgi:hypothetical protein